jgi:hypothetical protein
MQAERAGVSLIFQYRDLNPPDLIPRSFLQASSKYAGQIYIIDASAG